METELSQEIMLNQKYVKIRPLGGWKLFFVIKP